MRRIKLVMVAAMVLAGCGGGGSGSDGVIFEGTLTQRGPAAQMVLKHASGVRIDGVKVCVLGECSLTDGMGQWGVNLSEFAGGDVSISVEGHGISTSVTANVPASARTVELALEHTNNTVSIAKMTIDGDDHTGHDSADDHAAH